LSVARYEEEPVPHIQRSGARGGQGRSGDPVISPKKKPPQTDPKISTIFLNKDLSLHVLRGRVFWRVGGAGRVVEND